MENQTVMGKINILIVEDHKMIAEGLEQVTSRHPDISIQARVSSREAAMKILDEHVNVDLVLMDLFLGTEETHTEPEGFRAIRQINKEINRFSAKKIKIIVVTISEEGKWIEKSL